MKQNMKKIMAIVLSLTLVVGVVSIFAPKNTTTTAMAKQKTVYDEIKLSKLSDKKLENVAKTALDDGAKAAKEVNSYKYEADYKAALNTAMTSYYKKNDKKQLKSFTKNLDKRAKDVVANYEKAAKERAKGSKNYRVGKIDVVFTSGITKNEIKDICKAQDAKLDDCFKLANNKYYALIDISYGQTVKMAADSFSKYTFVKAADSDDIAKIENDSIEAITDVINLTNDKYINSMTYFSNMHVKGAWDYLRTHNHNKVKVAVIDAGCYHTNPDIQNIITEDSYDVIAEKPITEMVYDSKLNHGTAVIGTIAAESNNGKLISGVASGYDNSIVEILAINAGHFVESLNNCYFNSYDQSKAYAYAQSHGAKVINMSYGSLGKNDSVDEVFEDMYNDGIVLFASAGNENSNQIHYPSDSPYVISVGATDQNNIKASFSNYGYGKDICAPGVSLPCLSYDSNSITHMNGTSFSSPATAAVGAMMLSVNPNLDGYDVARIMQNTDTRIADIKTYDQFEHGIVNAEKCVKAADGYKNTDTYEGEETCLLNIADKAEITATNVYNSSAKSHLNDLDLNSFTTFNSGDSEIVLSFDKAYDVGVIKIDFLDSVKVAHNISYSSDGVNFNNIISSDKTTLPIQYTNNLERGYSETQSIKSVRIRLTNSDANFDISEIQIWARQTYNRKADSTTFQEPRLDIENFDAEIIGYHKVKLTWDVSPSMIEKGYEYVIYDLGVEVARTKNNSFVLENTTGEKGFLQYGVKTYYHGELGEWNLINIRDVNWDDYTTPSDTTIEQQTSSALTNLALGKPAVASSEENGGTKAEYAFDGNETTRWSSEWTDDEWIYVDLGKTCLVSQLEIKWETARASSYMVYTSQDKSVWAPCAQNTQNAENTTDTFSPRYARYVQIRGRGRNTGYGYSIFEMKVMGVDPDESTTVAPTTTAESTTLAPTTTVESTSAPEITTKRTRRIIPGGFTISTENVAAGKTAFASSEENDGNAAVKVCDGDMGTRWSSQWTDDEWIVVDLGEVMPIAQVKLHWEAAYGKDYVVQFSEDGDTYYDKRTTTNNTLRDTIEAFPAEYTRYIRVKCSQRGTGYGYSLFEIEAFPAIINGATTTVAPTTTTAQQFTNLALGKNATASTYENDSMSAVKAFDGDMGTRWASAWEDNQFIRVNLESKRFINHIVINWEAAYGKAYEIQLSDDGKIWNTKKTVSNSDGGIDTVQIGDYAQFVRVVCTERGTNYGFSIYEMAVMGY